MKRQDVVSILEVLLPYARRGEIRYRELVQTVEDPYWKALFVRYWQKYGQCVAELETKVLYHGGGLKPHNALLDEPVVDSVTQCLAEEFRTAHAYEDVLNDQLPVDVQMVLQRHILIFRDIARRLEQLEPAPRNTPPLTAAA